MKKILGLGNALVDLLVRLENEEFLKQNALLKGSMQLVDYSKVEELLKQLQESEKCIVAGGSAANTINGLANLGVDCGFVGRLGKDDFRNHYEEDLSRSGIAAHLYESETPTGRALTLITPDSERTFATYLGAALELAAEDIDGKVFEQYDMLHIEGYLVQNHALLESALIQAKNLDMLVSLDLASYNVVEDNLAFLQEMVEKYVDIVFANEEEALAFTACDHPEEALKSIKELCDIAVVKVGKRGAYAMDDAEGCFMPALEGHHPIDTTGAGDFFASGFLSGLTLKSSLKECLKRGHVLAGHVIEVVGSKLSVDDWKKIHQQLG